MRAPTRFIFKQIDLIEFIQTIKETSDLFGTFIDETSVFKLKVTKQSKPVLLQYLNQTSSNVISVERRKIVFKFTDQKELLPIITAAIETELYELPDNQKTYYRPQALKAVQKALPLYSFRFLYDEIQLILNPPEPSIDADSEEFKQEVKDIVARVKEKQKQKLNPPKKGLLE